MLSAYIQCCQEHGEGSFILMSRCDNAFYRCKALYRKELVVFKPLAFQPERCYHLNAALFNALVIILSEAVVAFL